MHYNDFSGQSFDPADNSRLAKQMYVNVAACTSTYIRVIQKEIETKLITTVVQIAYIERYSY